MPARFPKVLPLVSRRNPDILTIAHRGLWTSAPENSLASIRAAIAFGVEIVEIDTQATADGKLVIVHDETLDRTSTGTGIVGERDLATVRNARLRAGAGGETAAVTSERVPTLEEALEEARGRIAVNLDTKYPRDLPLVIAAVRRLSMQDGIIIKTDIEPTSQNFPAFDTDWLGSIPHMPMFRIRPGLFAEDLRLIERLAAPMVEVKFSSIADLAAARDELERQNIRVWINSLDVSHCLDFNDSRAMKDPDGVWGALVDAGVGAVQTDTVEAFKTWLAGRQMPSIAQ
jgi:glycerophosphoryl diester phosphodiesterase